jgi:hypothetical protein
MSTKPATKPVVVPTAAPVVVPPANVTLTRSTAPRKGSSIVYVIPGLRAIVKVTRTAFVNPPDTLVIQGSPFATPVAQLSKEERAARRKAMTPADLARLARERATRAVAKAAKLEAAL